MRHDRVCHSINIPKHARSRNPQYSIPQLLKRFRPGNISLWAIAHVVRHAVDLDHQSRCRAVKIDAIQADRMLLAEADAVQRAFQALPKQGFRKA